jgi:hypothetical protein
MSAHPQLDQDPKSPKTGTPRSRYLVYTSAGDRSNVQRWLKGEKNFDLWITHYGDGNSQLRTLADFYNQRRGGKYPNLHHVWLSHRELFSGYDAVFALDDDLEISGSEISHLFRILTRYELLLLQPAFSTAGKVSHPLTIAKLGSFGRYTNLVENGVAMFARSALDEFMAVYDPKIIGWGTDWWYMHVIRDRVEGRVAVIDAVVCVNPDERLEGRARAIDGLQSTEKRRQLWEETASQLKIEGPKGGVRSLGSLPPESQEDRNAMIAAPFKAAMTFLFHPNYLMRTKRLYWRIYWRFRGSKNAW